MKLMRIAVKQLEIALALLAASSALAAEPALRWSAPISVQQPAAFVALPLPASTYAHSLAPGLADLRVVDAQGQRVPHAWLPPREAEPQRQETAREATAYPLPRRAAPDAPLGSPIEVLVQGDSLRVRRLGDGKAPVPDTASPGWLFDLGERKAGEPAPQLLRLAWSGPAEFSASFDLDVSDTLREWRSAGSGQVMALAAASGALVQREVPLPPGVPRFVRLVWRDAATAPQLSGAQAISVQQAAGTTEPSETLRLKPSKPGKDDKEPAGALRFDLGGSLPLRAIDLQLPPGTRVAPVRLQARSNGSEPWHELGSWVFYRLERAGTASVAPPFTLQATARYLRVLPDERAGSLDAASTQLIAQVRPSTLVFASQGQPPYRLLGGAADAVSGALPASTLVPQLEEERPRLGRAQLGEWTEVAAVAQQAAADERKAQWRPWLLWAVLVAGVLGLGAMVWRLARGGATRPSSH